MFHQKMAGLGKKRSAIREIFEYSNRRKKEIGAENVFDFSLGNPNVPTPAVVTQTMQRLLAENSPVDLHGYTSAPGDFAVRERLAANLQKLYGVSASASLLYMTCGAAASLTITMLAMMSPGDEVIVPTPFFPEYRVFAGNAGLCLKEVASTPDFQPDVDVIERAITEHTGALLLNFPNNPTGAVATRKSLGAVAAMLERKSCEIGHPIYIISDEPYREFLYHGAQFVSIPALYRNTVICYSYSKSLSLPGERIGYIFVPSELEGAEELYYAIQGAGRSLGYVCAPSLLQYTVAECDGTPPDLTMYDRNRRTLSEALKRIGYTIVEPDGAFYLFVKALEEDAEAFAERAKKYELLLVPSDSFGVSGYVRIAYCVSYEQIVRSIPAFEALFEDYRSNMAN